MSADRAKKDLVSNSERSDRSPSPASPSPSWRRSEEESVCYVDWTLDTDQQESAYEYLAMLVQIAGTRPEVSLEQAREAIAHKFGVHLDEHLEIHRAAAPFDFLLILPYHEFYLTVLNDDRMVNTSAFTMIIRPWSRHVGAYHGTLYQKV